MIFYARSFHLMFCCFVGVSSAHCFSLLETLSVSFLSFALIASLIVVSRLSLSLPLGPAATAAFQQGSSQYSKLWKLMMLLLLHASTCIYLFHSVSSSRMQKICKNVSWCSMLRLVSCSAALRSLCGPDELRKKPMPKPQMNSKSLKTGNLLTCEELDWLAQQRPGPPTNLTYPARQWPQSVPTPSKPEPVPQGRSWHCSG